MSNGIVRMELQESLSEIRSGVLTCLLPDTELSRKLKYLVFGGPGAWERWYQVFVPKTENKRDSFVYGNVEFIRSTSMPPRHFYIVPIS